MQVSIAYFFLNNIIFIKSIKYTQNNITFSKPIFITIALNTDLKKY